MNTKELIDNLQEEADLCYAETATDVGHILEEAAKRLQEQHDLIVKVRATLFRGRTAGRDHSKAALDAENLIIESQIMKFDDALAPISDPMDTAQEREKPGLCGYCHTRHWGYQDHYMA